MAKVNCVNCGKEVGLVQQVQLADKQYICRDCAKTIMPLVDHLDITFDEYKAHAKQCEDGKKLYDAYFKKNRKVKKCAGGKILYDPATALVCVNDKKGMFGQAYYNVHRVADLDLYEKATSFTKGLEGRNLAKTSLIFSFRNTQGVGTYVFPCEDGAIKGVVKQFDEVFNGKGLLSRAKASAQKSKDQINAAINLGAAIKTAMSGEGAKNGEVDDAVRQGAAQAADSLEAAFYAGRQELLETANAAIKAVLG